MSKTEDKLIPRGGGIALWRQIAEEIEAEIRNGLYRAGERLPTESALVARFEVNRHTVRQALAALKQAGLVTSAQGLGFFVADSTVDYALGPQTRWKQTIARQSRRPSAHILGTRAIPARGRIADALGLADGTPLLVIDTLRLADETPLTLTYHHLEAARFPGIEAALARHMSVTEALAEFGITAFVRRHTAVSTRLPRLSEARLLQQQPTQPVLVTEGLNVDQDDRPTEYGISLFAGERVRLSVDPRAGSLEQD